MAADFAQLFNLLIDPPGNLVYHIILTFSVAGALQAALQNWRGAGSLPGRRLVTGLGLLLLARLILFAMAGAAWQGLLEEDLLPPLDRALTLACLALIVWIWAFPQPVRLADYGSLLVGLLVFALAAFGLAWWSNQSSEINFNGSWLDFSSQILALIILLAGVLALILRRPAGAGYSLAMLGLFALGHLAHLVFTPPQGDYSGVVRLSQLAAYPLLLALPGRLPYADAAPSRGETAAAPERRRYGIEPQLALTFLSLAAENESTRVCQAITRLVANTMLADLCLLLFPLDESERIALQCGYDLIREEHLGGGVIESRLVPVIDSALRRGLPLRLPASSNSPDLLNLGQILDLGSAGHMLAAPILGPNEEPMAQVLLLSPHSDRAWTSEDQSYLIEIAAPIARILQRERLFATLHQEMDVAIQALQTAREESQLARQEREELLERLASLQEQANQDRSQVESLTALISAQEEARQQAETSLEQATHLVSRLQEGMEGLDGEARETNILQAQAGVPPEETYREGELRLALEEIARLKAALAAAEQRAQEAASSPPGPQPGQAEIPTTPARHRDASSQEPAVPLNADGSNEKKDASDDSGPGGASE